MRRALVVTLEGDLHPSRVNGIYAAIRLLPGVAVIATLDSMSRETLDLLLMAPEPAVQKPRKRKRHQADLFGEDVA